MDVGIHFWNFTMDGGEKAILPALRDTARAADQAGFTLFTVMDHWFQMDRVQPAENPMLEAYSTLGYVAGITERIQLGALVTGVTYRYPGLLAKTVTTLDVLSNGRAWLGIGAAWYEREHLSLGVPYPPLKERFERLEETLQICLQMWSDDNGPYEGEHYTLGATLNSPQSVQRPHPPILIGGAGEKKTLRLVAQYADACNLFGTSTDELAHKIDVLRGHCDDVGRDMSEIRITVLGGDDPVGEPDAFLRQMEEFSALGVSHLQLRAPMEDPAGFVERFDETVGERLAAIGR
ncbi:LLM class F420-dependent oxidoreductase [Glaciibacter flavus]|uniref:LLM class F420-dependent oxidoreductase n=1 Tax=Orlajensenia flava TaxID=2565934 RepID=A0A4S4FV02_9MICO|nr:LLM class F420-dependent oxidoreductase [Glaciibacter flavus]THG33842.1 LLM class F420-dependent oxidoreductase [Glaciibacter flavus]